MNPEIELLYNIWDNVKPYVAVKERLHVAEEIVRTFDDITTATETLKVYLPMIPEDGIPIVNETVQLFTLGSRTYYKRIYDSNLNLGNAALNREKTLFQLKKVRIM